MEVCMIGYPERFPSYGYECLFEYRSLWASAPDAKRARWRQWERRAGAYWSFLVQPLIVCRAALSLARRGAFHLLYVSHPEIFVIFPLLLFRRLKPQATPVAVTVPAPFVISGELPYRSRWFRLRSQLALFQGRLLPRLAHVLFPSRYVPGTQRIRPRPSVHIVPEGYEDRIDSRDQETARRQLGIPCEGRMLLLFGVASKVKGADLLLEALKTVPPTFMVYIVGQTGGVYEPSWGSTEALQASGWQEHLVVVPRYVSDEEMRDYYAACDAVVIPYRRGFSSTSTHLRRASEYGKAVIASDQHTLAEVVRKYQVGLLFEPENVEALRQCLVEFARMPDAWFERIRENSRRVVADLSWEKVGGCYRRVFEQIVGQSA